MLEFPENTIMRLVAASYTAVWRPRPLGGAPVGLSCVQVDGPLNPSALTSTQTSLSKGGIVTTPGPFSPPNTIIRLLAGLKTAEWKLLTPGGPLMGLS